MLPQILFVEGLQDNLRHCFFDQGHHKPQLQLSDKHHNSVTIHAFVLQQVPVEAAWLNFVPLEPYTREKMPLCLHLNDTIGVFHGTLTKVVQTNNKPPSPF